LNRPEAGMPPIYLDHNGTRLSIQRWRQRCGRSWARRSAIRPAAIGPECRQKLPWTRPAAKSPRCSAPRPARSFLPAAVASKQSGDQGHVLPAEPQRGAHHHLGDRASRCSCSLPVSRTARRCAAVTCLAVDRTGRVDPKDVRRAIAPQTA
jgi:hypothetical protein